jgi:hypothetical protein
MISGWDKDATIKAETCWDTDIWIPEDNSFTWRLYFHKYQVIMT